MKNIGIATGRRKTSIARVYIRSGKGELKVNDKDIQSYFSTSEQVQMAKKPLMVTDSDSKYDILITVCGGGLSGQAGACAHGLARALSACSHAIHAWLNARSTVSVALDDASSSANVSINSTNF